jgi:hypothetical protein
MQGRVTVTAVASLIEKVIPMILFHRFVSTARILAFVLDCPRVQILRR